MVQIADYFTDYSFWVNFSKNSVLKRLRSIKRNVEYFQKWFTISTFMVYIYSVLKWRISGEMPLEKVKITRRFTLLTDASMDRSIFRFISLASNGDSDVGDNVIFMTATIWRCWWLVQLFWWLLQISQNFELVGTNILNLPRTHMISNKCHQN